MSAAVTILLVENEALILQVLEDGLREAGFAVTTAISGSEAIEKLEADAARFRGLVTDVQLQSGPPSGWDVAHRARELIPGLPILYLTGADPSGWTVSGVPDSLLLSKPFAIAQVVTALAQLLNAAAPSSNAAPPPPA